jgi:hypothetical protein
MLLGEPHDGAGNCFVRGAFTVTARSVTWPDIWPAEAFFPVCRMRRAARRFAATTGFQPETALST